MLKTMLAASVIVVGSASTTLALPLVPLQYDGTVDIYRATGTGNPTSADATWANALGATFLGSVTYTGALHFSTDTSGATPPDTTTVDQWLTSGGGSYVIDIVGETDFETFEISSPNINNDTALTTWFLFEGTTNSPKLQFIHDDGIQFCNGFFNTTSNECDDPFYDSRDPTTVETSAVLDWTGSDWSLVYAATNGDPSVLKVNAIPLPAAAWLLLGVSGGLIVAKRRSARNVA